MSQIGVLADVDLLLYAQTLDRFDQLSPQGQREAITLLLLFTGRVKCRRKNCPRYRCSDEERYNCLRWVVEHRQVV